MPSNKDCTKNALTQSRCIIDAILNDIVKTYPLTGGGGISSIKQESTWVYTVSILQEERIDLIAYTVEISREGIVAITDRKTGTESQGH